MRHTAATMPAAPSSRLALVTGGSRGLGAALCDHLLADGWRVIEFSRSAPHPYSIALDLSDPAQARATVARTLDGVDAAGLSAIAVFNNAGVLAPIGPAAIAPAAALLANLHANLATPLLLLAQIVARWQHHPARKRLVNISSGAAQTPYAGWSLYGTAKAGMEQFIRCLAAEQADEPQPFVAVNVYPGVIDTAMQAEIRATPDAQFPARARFVQRHASGALRPPERVAAAVLRIAARDDLQGGERYDVADHWD